MVTLFVPTFSIVFLASQSTISTIAKLSVTLPTINVLMHQHVSTSRETGSERRSGRLGKESAIPHNRQLVIKAGGGVYIYPANHLHPPPQREDEVGIRDKKIPLG